MSQATTLKYAYYSGCSLEATAREYDLSVRTVCDHLGIELEEIVDWNCCGASSGHSTSHRLASKLAGRNLALAEGMGMDIARVRETWMIMIPMFIRGPLNWLL